MKLSTLTICIALMVAAAAIAARTNQAQSAVQKRDQIWSKVMQSKGSTGSFPNSLQLIKLFWESMSVSGTTASDEFPPGRQKLIHSVGVIAKFHFEWIENSLGYTGLFEKANYGFLRFSSAAKPADKAPCGGSSPCITAGISVKLMRDNVKSGNFFAMYGLQGQDSFNMMKHNLCNHVNAPSDLSLPQKLLLKKFKTASDWPGFIGLSDLSAYGEDGTKVDDPKFPWALVFQPNPVYTNKLDQYNDNKYTEHIPNEIKNGAELYKVYAIDECLPQNEINGTYPVLIGKMVLDSDFVTSEYADETLFFQHQFIDEDFAQGTRGNDMKKCGAAPGRDAVEGIGIYPLAKPY